jgi:hypothetical protein
MRMAVTFCMDFSLTRGPMIAAPHNGKIVPVANNGQLSF